MRRKSPPRVMGPYLERGKWRIVVVENGQRRAFFFSSQEEALKLRSDFTKAVSPSLSRKLVDVIEERTAARLRNATCKPETVKSQEARLRLFLASYLDKDVAVLTPRAAAAHYQRYVERPSAKTGQSLSAASHQLDRLLAQELYAWAVKRGYLGTNPFQTVKAIGKLKAGKLQLRIDEARLFTKTAMQLFEEQNRPLAIGALTALMMGLRTSEVLRRVVRDLDDGARYLWIDQGKTKNARRHLEVPAPLQPYLLRLAHGKRPDEPLFGFGARVNRPHCQQAMQYTVAAICRRAGVPRVCPHSLRGLWATLAVGSGIASHTVAESLGHHSFAITKKHYAQPAAITNAGTARVASVLENGPVYKKTSAQDLLRQLDPETLAQLAELLAAGKGKDDPVN